MKLNWAIVVLILLLTIGCQQNDGDGGDDGGGLQEAVGDVFNLGSGNDQGSVPLALIDTISFEASDGLTIVGEYFTPPSVTQPDPDRLEDRDDFPFPGVLLLHMLNSDRTAWGNFIERLNANGYAVYAIDMRGHGETGGSNDWALAQDDVVRALNVLREQPDVDPERVFVIGGSIGSNLALLTGESEGVVDGAVLLSPGLDYRGVKTESAAQSMDRPILIMASEGDSYSAESSQTLHDLAANSRLEIYDGSLHGTRMLGTDLNIEEVILSWLEAQ